ncbi:unnamed protein product [Sphagnum jensenii]|uniref:molybdopterin molybdotransferase n=1 Tax=Sphagnum jensenii TaxID=128206 RepID=A0ABP0VHS9_9BRYO
MTPNDTSPLFLNIAVLTVSDSRDLAQDKSGDALAEMLQRDGHLLVERQIVRDDLPSIQAIVKNWILDKEIDVVLTTGGTGLTGRDVTPEALEPLFEKTIPGFGELFRMLSYQKIGPSTIQSRALAGVAQGTFIFALPGSTSACRDAWEMILHHQFDSRSKPCSFSSLIPRLTEK